MPHQPPFHIGFHPKNLLRNKIVGGSESKCAEPPIMVLLSYLRRFLIFMFVQSGFSLELPFPRLVTSPQLLRARPTGTHPCRANTLCLANQPYSLRLLCSSGLGFRIIAAPCGLSPQYAYRDGRTQKATDPKRISRCIRTFR